MTSHLRRWLRSLGPGLITGAADDDPSGIATYSQAGAQYGFGMLWTLPFTYPLMVSIQMVSARIGRVTGRGLAANLRLNYPNWIALPLVLLLLMANTINIAADISAMADAVHLVAGGPRHVYAVAFGMLCLLLQVFIPYERYVRVLKWLTLSLFAYVGTLFFVHVPWTTVVFDTLWPKIEHTNDYLGLAVSIFGTTISPYMFFWQAGQEVEEMGRRPRLSALMRRPAEAAHHLARIRLDTLLGMGFSQTVAFFIMLTTAVTLHVHGITDIQTSAQAAAALRPIAGDYAFVLFAAGIVGTGLLAVPVLAGSAAYAVAEFFRWRTGLGLKPEAAKGFYSIIAISTLLGVLLDFSNIDPMKALLWSAMINGVVAVPLMAVMMHMSGREKMMGRFVGSPRLRWMGWLATGIMTMATVAFGITNWYH